MTNRGTYHIKITIDSPEGLPVLRGMEIKLPFSRDAVEYNDRDLTKIFYRAIAEAMVESVEDTP